MNERIVVGVDGSPEATAALTWALEEAAVRHATVEAVHAFWCSYTSELQMSHLMELHRTADELLRSVVDPAAASHPGVAVTHKTVEGAPARILIDAATGADLLVVGSRGRGGFAGLLLGSVSHQCVHHAPCPVAVVRAAPSAQRPAAEAPYTVVVGVDGSPASHNTLRWALAEAGAHQGRVRALHVWTSPFSREVETVSPLDEEKLRVAAQERLDEAMAGLDAGGVPIDAEVAEGDPRRVLVDAAGDADLLVVGSHGRGRLAGMLLGSVSSFCVHHASVPVVVLHDRS